MPTLIRQALFERIKKLPALREHLESLRLATGVAVIFVGPMGQGASPDPRNPLCARMQETEAGRRRCTACIQRVLERAMEGPSHEDCESGLRETAVPLRVGGQVFGYFLFGGYFRKPADAATPAELRRRLEGCGIGLSEEFGKDFIAGIPVYEAPRELALVHLLEMVATQLALIITDNLAHPEKRLPDVIERACSLARREYREPLSLSSVAASLSVSAAHLSRLFHHSTGLPFNEYLTRLRTEEARKLLLGTTRSVTDIAYASGFQSISQFNRAFKAVHGVSPKSLRDKGAAKPGRRARAAGKKA